MSSILLYSPCMPEGPWFRYLENGYIEVQNIGVPKSSSFPSNVHQWKSLIYKYSSMWKISPSIVAAFMCQESGGHEKAVSTSNAYGLMQMLLSTAKMWGNRYYGINPDTITIQSLFDPEFNIKLATAGIADLMREHNNNIVRAAAYYNSGKNACSDCYTDSKTGEKHCCPPSRWGLRTNCGYIDAIIRFNNAAIDLGYSGIPILITRSPVWTAVAFVSSAVLAGSVVIFGAKKGLFRG